MGDGDERSAQPGDDRPAGSVAGDGAGYPASTSSDAPASGPTDAPASGPTVAPASDAPASGAGARRGPGRPRKAASSPKGRSDGKPGQSGAEPVRLRVDQAAKPPARPASSKPKAAAPGDDGNPQAVTTMVLQMAELAAMCTIGPVGKFQPIERGLIEPAMVRILTRMDAAAMARYSALSDPLLLGMGVCMYGFRIWTSSRAMAAASEQARVRVEPPAGGPAATAAPTPEPVTAVAGPPSPVDLAATREAARNGVAPAPVEILSHIESENLGALA